MDRHGPPCEAVQGVQCWECGFAAVEEWERGDHRTQTGHRRMGGFAKATKLLLTWLLVSVLLSGVGGLAYVFLVLN